VAILTGILNALLILTSLFLICLILIQRGKGGGLAGAFGGMGGSSAFGTKAGDVFTRVTIYVALVWGVLAMLLVYQSNRGTESAWGNDSAATSVSKTIDEKSGSGKGKAKSSATPATGSESSKAPAGASSSSPAPTNIPAIPDEPPAKSK
jgi:preprotein translocase subunit SecG